MKKFNWNSPDGILRGLGFVAVAAMIFSGWPASNASTDLRICGSFSDVVRAVQEEGFHPWFSYRAGEVNFKVMYWRNPQTEELYRIAPAASGRWCILGGGDEIVIYGEGGR